ncbi:hypothetical protein AB0L33_30935 [Streptomyces sp. NPDC052299]|uniref:hypothetical protein n=1 Tax=Streptomyces sp. NPDC052299 TaxID=3155054 RepID=UPI00341D784C
MTVRPLPALAGTAAALVLAAASMLTGTPSASASPVTDCTPRGTTELRGREYLYQQNEWDSDSEQCRLSKSGWSPFDETDDHSLAAGTAFPDASKVGVSVNGALSSGATP